MVVALFAIKSFISFLTKYGFKHFGYYRIILGVVFLLYAWQTGLILSVD
jgi:undecaprenyl-diphosphatase